MSTIRGWDGKISFSTNHCGLLTTKTIQKYESISTDTGDVNIFTSLMTFYYLYILNLSFFLGGYDGIQY